MARIIELNTAADPRLQRFANLRADVDRRLDAETFVVEGRWCLQRLIESDHHVLSVLVERRKAQEVANWLSAETPVYSLPPEQICEVVGFDFHRGMLACGRRPALRSLDQLRLGPTAVALAILGVNDPENLGSMIRTATALGVNDLLIGPKTEDPFSRRSIRVSMASVFQQRLYRLDDPETQFTQLQRTRDIRTVVTTLDADATPLAQFVPDDRQTILIVGNEAKGVAENIQSAATDRVTIPMKLGTDSLNVSVAAAIFLYQLLSIGQGESRKT